MLNKALLLASSRAPLSAGPPIYTGDFDFSIAQFSAHPSVPRSSLNIVPGDLVLCVTGVRALSNPFINGFTDLAETPRLDENISALVAGQVQTTSTGSLPQMTTGNQNGIRIYMRVRRANASMNHDEAFGDGIGLTATTPNLVTTVDNTLVVRVFIATDNDVNADSGYPPGTTGLFVRGSTGSVNNISLGVALETAEAAGAVGSAAFSSLTTSQNWQTITFALHGT